MKKSVVAAVLFAALPLYALATAFADDHVLVHPSALKWTPAPAGLPPGVQISVLADARKRNPEITPPAR